MKFSPTFSIVGQSLNARPVVSVSANATELNAVTPNHFLLRIAGLSLPLLANCEFDHRKHSARAHAYSTAVWSRWLKQYIPSLNSRTNWPSQSNRDLKTGDLVWTLESISPRSYYLLARVVKLNFGSDAVARSAEVRTASRNLIHPAVKLAPFFPFSIPIDELCFINVKLLSILA